MRQSTAFSLALPRHNQGVTPVKTSRHGRFATLDMLRGVAALLVLMIHYQWQHDPEWIIPHAYLAVDLFFVLSGFILTHVYRDRIAQGMSIRRFLSFRFVRIYPLYLLGTLILALPMLGRELIATEGTIGFDKWVPSAFLSFLLLPTPQALSYDPEVPFAFNLPAWSLWWEMVVNIAFAVWLRFYGGRHPWLLVAAFGTALLWLTSSTDTGIEGGWDFSTFWVGFARAGLGFFLGVNVYDLTRRFPPPPLPGALLAIPLILAVTVSLPDDRLHDLTCILLVFPCLIWLGSGATGGPRYRRCAEWVGYVSYPLYAVHWPLLLLIFKSFDHIAKVNPADTANVAAPIILLLVIGFAWLAGRQFDAPARRWLEARLGLAKGPTPVAQPAS